MEPLLGCKDPTLCVYGLTVSKDLWIVGTYYSDRNPNTLIRVRSLSTTMNRTGMEQWYVFDGGGQDRTTMGSGSILSYISGRTVEIE